MSTTPLRAVAFFDLDRTLLPHHTSLLYLRMLRRDGVIPLFTLMRAGFLLLLYFLNLVDTQRVVAAVIGRVAGGLDADHRARGERCARELIIPRLSAPALARLEEHRARGDDVVILSASPDYVVEPLGRHLRMAVRCSRFEVREGRLTGALAGPMCFGAHKVEAARLYAEARGVPLSACSFYTDSASDTPLLREVGTPVAVNPDPRLRRLARAHGWPRLRW
ncbi:MAG: HAD family hydrolase [Deltaproteobacteria bacterium]|nr:HAD family hydrolase [Deltaproteobacteria bacterium]